MLQQDTTTMDFEPRALRPAVLVDPIGEPLVENTGDTLEAVTALPLQP